MSKHWSDGLPKDACGKAVVWARAQESPQQAWDACERGDWMLWLLGKYNAARKKLILAACQCARLALRYVPKGEERPLQAIETTERWAKGRASMKEVKTAAGAAYAAACNAAGAAYAACNAACNAAGAAYAAAGAAGAADAADAAGNAACNAAGAAGAAGAADAACNAAGAAYAAAGAAGASVLLREAKIVRKYFPEYPKPREALKGKEKE